ncbi:MAG: hypothetical protein ACOX0Z_01630 [Candidatus Nanosyncoccaceae bacterium]|jgi:hypothetical protein
MRLCGTIYDISSWPAVYEAKKKILQEFIKRGEIAAGDERKLSERIGWLKQERELLAPKIEEVEKIRQSTGGLSIDEASTGYEAIMFIFATATSPEESFDKLLGDLLNAINANGETNQAKVDQIRTNHKLDKPRVSGYRTLFDDY